MHWCVIGVALPMSPLGHQSLHGVDLVVGRLLVMIVLSSLEHVLGIEKLGVDECGGIVTNAYHKYFC